MPTVSTIPLLLLVLLLWRATQGKLLSIVLFLSIFQAASVLNLGSLGVTPWILILVVGLLIKAVQHPKFVPITALSTNMLAVRILLVFICYAIFSGLFFPLLFRGVSVRSSHDPSLAPLVFGIANVAQICYLLAAVAVFAMALTSSQKAIESAFKWYVYGCEAVSVIAMYQLANAVIGIPYPSALFYSNPRYVIYPAYMINGMWRLNSTFTEASSMAGHLSVGIVLLGWNVFTQPFRWRSTFSLVLMIFSLLLTLSSTGYISLIVILLAGLVLSLRTLFGARSVSFTRIKAVLMLSTVLIVTIVLITTNISATLDKAVHSVLLDKENSLSYKERTESNLSAMETAKQTYYVGSGWGSVRCSSLGAGLLSTVGLIGVFLFCTFLLSLTLPLFSQGYNRQLSHVYEKSLLGTFVILAAMMVAGNEPDQPILWVLFATCSIGSSTYRVFRGTNQSNSNNRMIQHSARLM